MPCAKGAGRSTMSMPGAAMRRAMARTGKDFGMTDPLPKNRKQARPHNREVEDEMICPPPAQGLPPRPATEPATDDRAGKKRETIPVIL
jgi:hypothetical protein